MQQQERGRRSRHNADAGQRAQPAGEPLSALGQVVRRSRRRGDRPWAAARLRGDQSQRRHRPRGLRVGQPGYQVGRCQQVADAQPGEPPGLGQAADDDQPGQVGAGRQRLGLPRHAVGEGLVHDEYPTRAGQRGNYVRRMQHRRRVGRVAEHHQVGVRWHQRGVQCERFGEHDPAYRLLGRPQRRLRGGERRVHAHGEPGPQRPGKQHEGLGRAGREQHLGGTAPVPGGDRGSGRHGVGIAAEGVQGRGQPGLQPRRRPG